MYTKQDILRAMTVTKSNKAASRYLNCDMRTYRTYARMYLDDETGQNLFEKHKNRGGAGVAKFSKVKEKKGDIKKVLAGEIDTVDDYDINTFKAALIRDFILMEECSCCGFKEARIIDYKVPLLLNFKDRNRKNWRQENLELLCYNCYFLRVGDIFNKKQTQDIESHVSVGKKEDEVHWDLEPFMHEHLRSLGLIDDEPSKEEDYIAYKDYVK